MREAMKRYLKRSVIAYPNPSQWWAFILNETSGNFGPLLEGYKGDIQKIHRTISSEAEHEAIEAGFDSVYDKSTDKIAEPNKQIKVHCPLCGMKRVVNSEHLDEEYCHICSERGIENKLISGKAGIYY